MKLLVGLPKEHLLVYLIYKTGNLVKPKVDSEFLSKPLPEGYKYVSLSEIEGPKGGVYHYIGDDVKGNPVFFNNNKFVSV